MGLRDAWYALQERYVDWRYGPVQDVDDDQEEEEDDEDVFAQPTAQRRTIQRVQPDEYDEEDEQVEGEPVDDEVDTLIKDEMHNSAGAHDWVVDKVVWTAAVLGTPILWFILGLGNAQLFSDFRGLSWDPLVILAYIGGFAYELFGIALILMAGRYAAKKAWGQMIGVLLFAIFVASSSFFAQYVLLQSEYANHLLSFSDTVLQGLPISNHNGIFFLRALMPTVLEFAIVFIFAERNPSAVETLRKKMKLQQELHQYQQGKAGMAQSQAINNMVINVAAGLTRQMEHQMEQFTNHGMVVQDTTPLMIERRTVERLPEQAQSLTPAQQAQPKQFVQPNPNTLTQRIVPKPVVQPVAKPPVQQPKAVSLEDDEEEMQPQKPLLPPVQPQQLTPKPPPRPFAKTGGDVAQQQTSRLSEKDAELAKIRSLLQ